jgi:hypothetical protein
MLIYRFRVTSEEHEGFLREIEIQPNQTFLDFHYILVDSCELLQCDRASFFMTDKKYKKDREISLKHEKRSVRRYDEDLDQVVTESISLPLMKTERLKHYIEDPHQHMIYEFSGQEHYAFHIELFKIFPFEGITSFPKCAKRLGELPKKAVLPAPLSDLPPEPKIIPPKIRVPKLEDIDKLADLVENEEELAAIENDLGGLIDEALQEPADSPEEHAETDMSDFLYEEGQEETIEEPGFDNIENYEDIDNLDKRLSGFDREQDE